VVDFYTSCTNGNRKECSIGELQNLQLYHNCVSTLPEKNQKHTQQTAHFETNCQCILMLNAINGKNESK